MYEVGYFASAHDFEKRHGSSREKRPAERRIYCLHHADLPPPPPLEHLQVVKADSYRVSRFIADFIEEARISPDETKRAEAIKDITDCFEQRDAVSYAAPRLTLTVKDKDKIDPFVADLADALPDGSFFSGREINEIFQRGVDRNILSWRDAVAFTRRIAKHTDAREYFELKWLSELVDIMYNAKDDFYNPSLLLRGLVSKGVPNQAYSPAIRKISKRRNGALTCEILFLDWEGYQYPKAPEHIRHLMVAVRVATRFRQEFLEEFRDIGETAAYEGKRGRAFAFKHKIWQAFYDVMTESTIRGLSTAEFNRAFNAVGRGVIRVISDDFSAAHLKFANLVGGRADLSSSLINSSNDPFRDDEISTLDEIYAVFDQVNLSFLAMAHVTLDDYFASFASSETWDAVKQRVAGTGPEAADRSSPRRPPRSEDNVVPIKRS